MSGGLIMNWHTFANWFAEDSMRISDKHQVDVIVVEHILRRVKPIVSADEIVQKLNVAELVHHTNLEHLSAAMIVRRQACFTQPFGRSIHLPVDSLEHAEDES